jgi:hypothetical protein
MESTLDAFLRGFYQPTKMRKLPFSPNGSASKKELVSEFTGANCILKE